MKILKVLLRVLFIVIFVLSLTLNIVLGFSSTNKLLFDGNDKNSLVQLYYNAIYNLRNSDQYSFIYEYKGIENDILVSYKYDLSCANETKEDVTELKCTQIGTVTDPEGKELRITYFPGDNNSYKNTGDKKIKSNYTNNDLNTFANQMASRAISSLRNYMYNIANGENPGTLLTPIDTSISFDFNTFSLIKTVTTSIDLENENDYVYEFVFDGLDRLTSINLYVDENSSSNFSMKIKYEKTNHNFPKFDDYVVEGVGE